MSSLIDFLIEGEQDYPYVFYACAIALVAIVLCGSGRLGFYGWVMGVLRAGVIRCSGWREVRARRALANEAMRAARVSVRGGKSEEEVEQWLSEAARRSGSLSADEELEVQAEIGALRAEMRARRPSVKCGNCSAQLLSDAKSCPQCGTNVPSGTHAVAMAPNRAESAELTHQRGSLSNHTNCTSDADAPGESDRQIPRHELRLRSAIVKDFGDKCERNGTEIPWSEMDKFADVMASVINNVRIAAPDYLKKRRNRNTVRECLQEFGCHDVELRRYATVEETAIRLAEFMRTSPPLQIPAHVSSAIVHGLALEIARMRQSQESVESTGDCPICRHGRLQVLSHGVDTAAGAGGYLLGRALFGPIGGVVGAGLGASPRRPELICPSCGFRQQIE